MSVERKGHGQVARGRSSLLAPHRRRPRRRECLARVRIPRLPLAAGVVPATRSYRTPDPHCPVAVVHGGPLVGRPATAIAVNACTTGQAVAVAFAAD